MDKDRVKGAIDDSAGRIKRQVGEWTGDGEAQIEGAVQQVKGKAEKVLGKIKDAARDSKNKTEQHVNRTSEPKEERIIISHK
ncbi:MAG: CsbD family protein [Terracidiphilus sp.]